MEKKRMKTRKKEKKKMEEKNMGSSIRLQVVEMVVLAKLNKTFI